MRPQRPLALALVGVLLTLPVRQPTQATAPAGPGAPGGAPARPGLLHGRHVSRTHVVFLHADRHWLAARAGGPAARLTEREGVERSPRFSPDGRTVAFSADYDGTFSLYTAPAGPGGAPARVTHHPGGDLLDG